MFIGIMIALGIVTALAAKSRGRDFWAWFIIGACTGIFGLIAVLVMAEVETNQGG
jgi:hypothetical protein